MKVYKVTALEDWDVEVRYLIKAETVEEAKSLVESGEGEYLDHDCRDTGLDITVESVTCEEC